MVMVWFSWMAPNMLCFDYVSIHPRPDSLRLKHMKALGPEGVEPMIWSLDRAEGACYFVPS